MSSFNWIGFEKNHYDEGENKVTVSWNEGILEFIPKYVEWTKNEYMPSAYVYEMPIKNDASFTDLSKPYYRFWFYAEQYPYLENVNVTYHTHIQTYGDTQGTKKNGQMAGTSGESKRLENIWIKVEGNANLGVQYSTHCQTYGWLGWAKNGEPSGTAGYAKRLEGIQVVVVKKGEAAPGLKYAGVDGSSSKYSSQAYVDKNNAAIVIPGDVNAPIVSYKTHVQSFGWQKWVYNGAMSGTEGKAKRLEGIQIVLVPAGGAAPAKSYGGITSVQDKAYIEK